MSNDLSIESAINGMMEGRIRIPDFQRGFVWDADRVAYFMDTLYKGYPFGSLLLWRTKHQLRTERKIGPFELPRKDPGLPIDYILDGQQRLTSIFGVFQTQIDGDQGDGWLPIYFDHVSAEDAQESQFVALPEDKVEPERHFPLKVLFSPSQYRAATSTLDETLALRLDEVQKRFLQATLPVQSFETEDQAEVAIVFERVNRLGIALDALQLLTAWSWSEEFHLQEQFSELAEEVAEFGFSAIDQDPNLLLRCCAAVISGDASPSALVSLNGGVVRDRFDEIRNGVLGAIDFLRKNLRVETLDNLPYPAALVPLAVLFAVSGNKQVKLKSASRKRILRWFWRTCFSRRYSSGVLRSLKTDIAAMVVLREGGKSNLGDFPATVEPDFFTENAFIASVVNTKTFVLLLAQQHPRSFVSGSPVDLGKVLREYNRNEFHHLFPRAFLRDAFKTSAINRLSNFVFLSKVDNQTLGGVAPSEYRAHMDGDLGKILKSALCPPSLFDDDYEKFTAERAELLAEAAQALLD
jgi:hypothetical protein